MDFLVIYLEPRGHAICQPSSYKKSCLPLCRRHIVIMGYYVSGITFCGIFNQKKRSSFVSKTACNLHKNRGEKCEVPGI